MDPSDNTIYFYDQSSLPGKDKLPSDIFPKSSLKKEIGQFNLYGYSIGGKNKTPKNSSNFVHKVGIVTAITPEYATMISIGATAAGQVVNESATAFSRWNAGIKDRFRTDIVTGQNSIQFGSATQQAALQKMKEYEQIKNQYFFTIGKRTNSEETLYYLGLTKEIPSPGFFSGLSNFLGSGATAGLAALLAVGLTKAPSFIQNQIFNIFGQKASQNQNTNPTGVPYINDELIKSNQSVYYAYYKQLQNLASLKYNKASGDIGFLPFKLQLDMDGISGMKIYNRIDINSRFLPSNYPETLEFLVTDVTHTLSNNQWITSIDSIASVGNIFTTKELEDVTLLPQNYQPINFLPTIGQNGLVGTNVNQLAKSVSTNGTNANRLRATLAQLGYTEKGKEIDNGGDITANTEKMASAIFRKIKQLYPSIQVKVTGGNDYFHTQLTYISRHTRGRGIDFVISPATEQNIDNVVGILKSFTKGGNGNIRYIDEYRNPTRSASAKHFHISYGQGTEASSELKEAQQSNIVAYTVPNDEPPNGVSGEDRESMYRDKQRIIRDINKEILELGGTRQFNPNIAEDGSGGGYSYNDINPELQDAREYLNNLKRNPNAQYGPTSTQNLLDQSPTAIKLPIVLGDIPSSPLNLDSDGFIIDP